MKVLLINGSPRKNGNTGIALSEVARALEENGIDTEIVSIGTKAVQGCIGRNMAWMLKSRAAGNLPEPEPEAPVRTNFIR